MNQFIAFILILSFPFISFANDKLSYADGKGLGQSLTQGPESLKTADVPFYKGATVPETHYQENFHKMGDAATDMTHDPENETGAAVINSQRERLEHEFRITEDDPLIQLSNEINKDPIAVIGGEPERNMGGKKEVVETIHVCEESAEPVTYTCDQTRHIKLRKTTEKRYEKTLFYRRSIFGRSYAPQQSSYSFKEVTPWSRTITGKGGYVEGQNNIYIDVEVLTSDPLDDFIDDQCAGYEKQSNQGLCRYGEEEVLEGPETRKFCEGDECLKVTRDWWKRRRTYHCKYPSKDNCSPFRSAGCEQTRADCKIRVGGICVEHHKTFLCRSEKLGNGITKIGGDVPFCLDGNCDDRSWSANTDFAEAMSKMSIFREIANDMDAENATVFRGEGMKCSKSTLSFQDCCGSGGWGRSVGLGQNCKEEEKNLQKEREANKCVRVGTYCSQKERLTGICLTKKTSFCCFGSKLAKIVHEQGRAQLGIGWGDAEHPECRPFNVNELQQIDFSKIDLSELFSEIRAKTNIDNVAKSASNLGENWQAKIKAAKRKQSPDGKVKASDLHNTKENPDVSL